MSNSEPAGVIGQLQRAQNAHDLEALAACFAEAYQSEQPAHPDRGFTGREQVRKNWGTIFRDIPDFRAELLRSATTDNTVWSEWHWQGTPAAGGNFEWRGIMIMGIAGDRIAWARLYMGPVEQVGQGIDAAVRDMSHDRPRSGG